MAKQKTTRQIVDELIERKTKEAQAKATTKPTKQKVEKVQTKAATNNGAKTEQAMKVPKATKIKRAIGLTLGAVGLATAVVVPIVVYNSNKNIIISIYNQNFAFEKQSISIKKGTKAKDLAIIEFEGYEFQGYFKDEACTIPLEETETLTADTTIYASYRQFFNLTLNLDEQENTYKIYADETLNQALERLNVDLEKSGYELQGLYTSTDYLTKYNQETSLTENITLHAYYKQIHTLTLNVDGQATDYVYYVEETLSEALERLNLLETYNYNTTCGFFLDETLSQEIELESYQLTQTATIYTKLATLNYLTFTLTDNESYTVSGNNWSYSGEIVLPKMYNNIAVETMGLFSEYFDDDYRYYGFNLNSIVIPSTIKELVYGALDGCENLKTVYFVGNSNLTSIGAYAFQYCSNLTSIEIPAGVTSIEYGVFEWCDSLGSVTFEIDSKLTNINTCAFLNCTSLTSIEIPKLVTNIGSAAFSGCSSLISIEIPASVTSIGKQAFSSCSSLKNIEVLSGEITSIGSSAFSGCTSLTEITIPSSVTSIGEYAFSGCTSLTEISIPNGVRHIYQYTFSCCTGLTKITFPAGTTLISRLAFNNCTSLTSIIIDENNTVYTSKDKNGNNNCIIEIESNTLIRGTAQTVIPDDGSVTIIDDYAFRSCIGLTEITIPSSVTTILAGAFRGCSNLESLTLNAKEGYKWQVNSIDCSTLTMEEIVAYAKQGKTFQQVEE